MPVVWPTGIPPPVSGSPVGLSWCEVFVEGGRVVGGGVDVATATFTTLAVCASSVTTTDGTVAAWPPCAACVSVIPNMVPTGARRTVLRALQTGQTWQ